ncbi:unnamed protein product, partial [Brassicogethes aeneus]
DSDQGSWESGLSYECRSLLFKALHNLIERCLLSRDFIRLGKWFVQPSDGPRRAAHHPHQQQQQQSESAAPNGTGSNNLSFSFAFFVHGESSVCASVDVRQHPAVRRLSRGHLQQASASTSGLKVILAPFGLAGTLTGQCFKSPEICSRLIEDWSHFYPLDKTSGLTESSVVEVVVDGIKLRYPSCYVLVTDLDDNANQTILQTNNLGPATNERGTKNNGTNSPILVQAPAPQLVQISSKVPQPGPYSVSVEHQFSMSREPTAATVLPERAWQECLLGGPTAHCGQQQQQQQASLGGAACDGSWDFVEPSRRTNCTCSKCRKQSAGAASSSRWRSDGGGGKGSGRAAAAGGGGRVPFHRRAPPSQQQPPPPSITANAPPPGTPDRCPGSYTPQGGPPSYPRTQESTAIPSVGSPPSVAPSPLPNPSSQPASVPPGDPTMPTLSPHPPLTAEKTRTPDEPPKSVESRLNSPADCKGESQASGAGAPALKRPILSSKEYEAALGEEEETLEMLYDYSTLIAWLNHPVKRFKPDGADGARSRSVKTDLYSLYSGGGASNNNNDLKNVQIKQEIKLENLDMEADSMASLAHPHGVKRPGDPYEFEEEGGGANCNMDGFKRGQQPVKEEPPKDKKINAENLLTSEGLQPSYKDLDQIFDNSDDTSSDEAMQTQTPPGSTPASVHEHESKRLSSGYGQNMGIVRAEELSKMFPTPPSLEHNPIASPCGQTDLMMPSFESELGIVKIKQEIYPNMGSPQEENIEDWSFVFKAPLMCKMVGSSKYAPLTNLPSQSLPAVALPTHCVYKPSWMTQHIEKAAAAAQNQPPALPAAAQQLNPAQPASAHHFPQSPHCGFRLPPPPYEQPSPATSTTSSYLNKNLNSVEPTPAVSAQKTPEASSLVLNILLTDTAFNIFRDHNFDSCTLCVCNAAGKVVGNIRGADAGVYLLNSSADKHHAAALPNSHSPFQQQQQQHGQYGGMMSPQHHLGGMGEEDSIRCTCGFSAVVNRQLAHGSGLFYEDEMEITGIAEDPGEKKKPSLLTFLINNNSIKMDANLDREQLDAIPHSLLELVREQCVIIPNSANSLSRAARFLRMKRTHNSNNGSKGFNVLEFNDGNEVTSIALDQSRSRIEDGQHKKSHRGGGVHKWPFLRASGPQCSQDVVRVMKALQPLLQEAIQKKCQTRLWEAPSTVKGPLTWRQFHRLAGRGTEDRCEPQPIPSVIVGHDKDWLSLSPYALQHWETLLLEPYSYARDVAYVVVAPDNEAILPRVRTFFKELSTAYEMCKLGRHSPITRGLRDGILRVGKTAKTKIGNEPVEEWFTLLGEGETSDMLKLYAQVCKHHLAPHLQQVPMDKTLLDPPKESDEKATASPMPPPGTPDGGPAQAAERPPAAPKGEQEEQKDPGTPTAGGGLPEPAHDDEDREAPSIVVYLVEPFTFGSDQPELQRLACLALLRCYQSLAAALPENIRNNITVQIISLESIVELNKSRDHMKHSDHMRALALNIFSQCRRLLVHTNNVKSLTGFGTAAMTDLFLKNKDEKNRAPFKLYTPPYILAPMREKVESVEAFGKGALDQAAVLYLSYCLSEDQSWLLAVATDERGEIFETITINVDIPNRSRRRKASARRVGLEKLMGFILGVMSQSVRPWRLVVGRLGRIGHGELKGWSWLLSKQNLLKASKNLKEICNQCSIMYPNSVPCILSACLVSMEPDTALRLMPDQFTPDERFSQVSVNSQLSAPHDVSCTHILVFPTSATTQSSQAAFQETCATTELDADLLADLDMEDIPDGFDGMNDIMGQDIFSWNGQSPTGSPRRESSGVRSPTCGVNNGRQGSPYMGGINSKGAEPNEEVGTVLQQPLALGYLVSTAPTGRMPKWFWSSCPHLEGNCPAFLKNALHLHSPNVQQNSDDPFQQSAVTSHQLDSQYTTDVLRYVLEGYNALSWLALDSNTKDRLSCLPVHMQVLVQLYHTAAALL